MAAAEAALGAEAERDATRGDEGAAETTRLTEGSMATTRGPSMRRGGGGERRRGGPLGVRSRETDGRVVEVDVEVGLGRGGGCFASEAGGRFANANGRLVDAGKAFAGGGFDRLRCRRWSVPPGSGDGPDFSAQVLHCVPS